MGERAFCSAKRPYLYILRTKLQIFIAYSIGNFNYCESYLARMILPQLSLTGMIKLLIGEIMFCCIKRQPKCELVPKLQTNNRRGDRLF